SKYQYGSGEPLTFIPRTKIKKGNDRGQKARFQHLLFPFFSEGVLNKTLSYGEEERKCLKPENFHK
ncbi:hypothetical protein ACVD1I_22585, partial [Escherichia coli]